VEATTTTLQAAMPSADTLEEEAMDFADRLYCRQVAPLIDSLRRGPGWWRTLKLRRPRAGSTGLMHENAWR
jgi:hypothetical protein